MTTFEFSVVLQGAPAVNEDLADTLFAAGCDDGTPGMCHGLTVIDFHRDAASLEEAIQSAIADVRSAGCIAARVEIDGAS